MHGCPWQTGRWSHMWVLEREIESHHWPIELKWPECGPFKMATCQKEAGWRSNKRSSAQMWLIQTRTAAATCASNRWLSDKASWLTCQCGSTPDGQFVIMQRFSRALVLLQQQTSDTERKTHTKMWETPQSTQQGICLSILKSVKVKEALTDMTAHQSDEGGFWVKAKK